MFIVGIVFNIVVRYDCMYVRHPRAFLIDRALCNYYYYYVLLRCTLRYLNMFAFVAIGYIVYSAA